MLKIVSSNKEISYGLTPRSLNSLILLNRKLEEDHDMRGIWDIEDYIYHGCDAISRSGLIKYLSSPANYLLPTPENKAFTFGRGFHTKLLEGDFCFNSKFATAPKVNRTTKAGKSEWAEFLKKNEGKSVLTADESIMLENMINNCREDKDVMYYLGSKDALIESSCFVREDNIWTKARMDLWARETAVEFKTTIDSTLDTFERNFFKYGYDIQSAFYKDRFEAATDLIIDEYKVIAVEKNPPYKIYKINVNQDALEVGRVRYKKLLEAHQICTYEQYWPHSNTGFSDIRVPDYIAAKFL